MPVSYDHVGNTPKEADDNLYNSTDTVTEDAVARADTANVSSPEFINYATALGTYEARADTEPLAERRARENAETFAATDFMRAEPTP